VNFVVDERGDVVARVDSDRRSNRWSIHAYDGNRSRQVLDGVSQTGAPPSVFGLLPDGRLAVVDDDAEFPALTALSPQDGALETVFARESHEVTHAIRDPWTRRVVGVGWTETESLQHYFDADLQRGYEQAVAAFEDGVARLVSWSRDRRRILVYGEHALDGGGYYVLEPGASRMELIAMRYPQIAQADIGVRLSISYRARDGATIPAYLTLPDAETRGAPLVLLVHGGPHARDDMDFDWWASFLASRGYAVLQPNFRGSTGYGRSWEHAGRRQWGGLMQTDVEDGVTALERSGIAEAGRVCIIGASYGGYATQHEMPVPRQAQDEMRVFVDRMRAFRFL
jgi:dipeptidyl aminopeptidase/acylaminoacyl peptidase